VKTPLGAADGHPPARSRGAVQRPTRWPAGTAEERVPGLLRHRPGHQRWQRRLPPDSSRSATASHAGSATATPTAWVSPGGRRARHVRVATTGCLLQGRCPRAAGPSDHHRLGATLVDPVGQAGRESRARHRRGARTRCRHRRRSPGPPRSRTPPRNRRGQDQLRPIVRLDHGTAEPHCLVAQLRDICRKTCTCTCPLPLTMRFTPKQVRLFPVASSSHDLIRLQSQTWYSDRDFEFSFTIERPRDRLWVAPAVDMMLLVAGVFFGFLPWAGSRPV